MLEQQSLTRFNELLKFKESMQVVQVLDGTIIKKLLYILLCFI